MKIAQVAPLHESVPPRLYGGTERVVSYLTEELVTQGHEVTLFASGDSETSATLKPMVNQALRLDKHSVDKMASHILMVERVAKQADDFDIIHFHIDYLHFPVSRHQKLSQLTTLHGRLDLPELFPLYKEYSDMPLISISNSQRKPLPFANWQTTIYNGVPEHTYDFNPRNGEYLALLGRVSPEKGIDRAIEIAIRSDMKIKIAAKIDSADQEYYEEIIKPLFNHPLVEYVGEINEYEKNDFLGNAHALLFPIDWPEPFGLVMIEAMACGTPVIAFRCGAVPEVILDGITGFIVDDIDDAVKKVQLINTIDRRRCRQEFENRFSARHMTKTYVSAYHQLINNIIKPRLTG